MAKMFRCDKCELVFAEEGKQTTAGRAVPIKENVSPSDKVDVLIQLLTASGSSGQSDLCTKCYFELAEEAFNKLRNSIPVLPPVT